MANTYKLARYIVPNRIAFYRSNGGKYFPDFKVQAVADIDSNGSNVIPTPHLHPHR